MIFEIANSSTSIRSAKQADRQALYNLLEYETFSHRHMDWKSPLEWIGAEPFLISQKFGQPTALLACPPDPREIAWIRAFASSSLFDHTQSWDMLWKEAKDRLHEIPGVERALSIVMDEWFRELLIKGGFQHHTNVIMLSWENTIKQPPPPVSPVNIRQMQAADLPEIFKIDNAAFKPIWHNSLEMIQLAFADSLFSTVSTDQNGITGYQITTHSPFGGHLARLAVKPDTQGQGIGYCLVYDLLQRMRAIRGLRVTVNTQEDNRPSQFLYKKANFHLTGESYPIYEYNLKH